MNGLLATSDFKKLDSDAIFISVDVVDLHSIILIDFGIERVPDFAKMHCSIKIDNCSLNIKDLEKCLTFICLL